MLWKSWICGLFAPTLPTELLSIDFETVNEPESVAPGQPLVGGQPHAVVARVGNRFLNEKLWYLEIGRTPLMPWL